MTTVTRHDGTLVGGLALLAACSPGLPDLDGLSSWDGAHVSYYASPSLEPCKGTPTYVDAFVPFVAGELGIPTPTGLQYVWLDSTDLAQTDCVNHSCQISDFAVSPDPGHLHEVVHAVTWDNSMNQWPFFTEGIAVAYDPWNGDEMGPRYLIPVVPGEPLPDPRPMMLLPSADSIPYGVPGSFVAFLLSRHGPERFVDFTRHLTLPRTLDNLQEMFRRAYGSELDAEVDLFMYGPPCDDDAFPVRVYDCAMPNVPWADAAQWSYSDVMDCHEGDILGGIGLDAAWHSIRSVTLDVPTSGRYVLSAVSDNDVDVQIGACFGCPWEPRSFLVQAGEAVDVDLDAGPYYVRIRAMSDESPTVDVWLFPDDGAL